MHMCLIVQIVYIYLSGLIPNWYPLQEICSHYNLIKKKTLTGFDNPSMFTRHHQDYMHNLEYLFFIFVFPPFTTFATLMICNEEIQKGRKKKNRNGEGHSTVKSNYL